MAVVLQVAATTLILPWSVDLTKPAVGSDDSVFWGALPIVFRTVREGVAHRSAHQGVVSAPSSCRARPLDVGLACCIRRRIGDRAVVLDCAATGV